MNRDADLLGRMALALAGVLALDLAFAGLLAVVLAPWASPVGAAVAARAGVDVPRVVGTGALLALALVVVVWAQFRYTRRSLLASVDARPVTENSHPDLAGRVRRLANLAGVEPPGLAVVDSDVPNCFSVAGLGAGTVVVSTGLLDRLDGDELDTVLAHELAHVLNRDAAVLTLSSFLPALVDDRPAGVLGPVPRPVTWAVVLVVGYPLAAGAVDAPAFSPVALLGYLALVVVVVLLGGAAAGVLAVPMAALSRHLATAREFAADRASATLTGEPAALANALERLTGDSSDRPAVDARSDAVSTLCLLPGGFERTVDDPAGPAGDAERADRQFVVATTAHPPTDERIDRLRELAADIETGTGPYPSPSDW